MRHPTSANQRTKDASEALIHSAQISLAGSFGSWITAYMEVLYDPEQSFGSGTITDLNRNQLQLRRGHVLFVNDSKATNADSTEKALTAFRDIHWILGGKAKEGGIFPLVPYFERVAHAYLIGAASDRRRRLLTQNPSHVFSSGGHQLCYYCHWCYPPPLP